MIELKTRRTWTLRRSIGRFAAITTVAAALTACGTASHSSTTTSSSAGSRSASNPSAGSNNLERFAQCMRSHGAPTFPDPTAQGTFQLPTSLTASPQFKAADDACKSLAPAGPLRGEAPTTAQLGKALNVVHCMRRHGVDMSDPSPQGTFQNQLAASGIDPNSPQFKQALYSCRTLLPPGNGFGTGH